MKALVYSLAVGCLVSMTVAAVAAEGPLPVQPMDNRRVLPPAPPSPFAEEPPAAPVIAPATAPKDNPAEPVTLLLPPEPQEEPLPLPPVEKSIVRGTADPASAAQDLQSRSSRGEVAEEDLKSLVKAASIEIRPGVTEIIRIAVNLTNRIVTPFQKPVVRTVNDVLVTVEDGGVIYLSTSQEKVPVSVFITEEGDESVAISLVLYPLDVPSREIQLTFPEALSRRLPRPEAVRWESSQPYIKTIRDLFREVALGNVPQGYAFETTDPAAHDVPTCALPAALTIEFAQTLVGGRMNIHVGRIQNLGPQPIELRESACADMNVVAAAFWPNVFLDPGVSTEIYVLRRRSQSGETTTKRPFLTVGAQQ